MEPEVLGSGPARTLAQWSRAGLQQALLTAGCNRLLALLLNHRSTILQNAMTRNASPKRHGQDIPEVLPASVIRELDGSEAHLKGKAGSQEVCYSSRAQTIRLETATRGSAHEGHGEPQAANALVSPCATQAMSMLITTLTSC